ncbi:MAG: hypothetical protein KAT58_02560 [candidate division Zixibacteria bacterium]|nr:hypothetical protein [candidate division Zixibacteria bacterium]
MSESSSGRLDLLRNSSHVGQEPCAPDFACWFLVACMVYPLVHHDAAMVVMVVAELNGKRCKREPDFATADLAVQQPA